MGHVLDGCNKKVSALSIWDIAGIESRVCPRIQRSTRDLSRGITSQWAEVFEGSLLEGLMRIRKGRKQTQSCWYSISFNGCGSVTSWKKSKGFSSWGLRRKCPKKMEGNRKILDEEWTGEWALTRLAKEFIYGSKALRSVSCVILCASNSYLLCHGINVT